MFSKPQIDQQIAVVLILSEGKDTRKEDIGQSFLFTMQEVTPDFRFLKREGIGKAAIIGEIISGKGGGKS